MDAFAYYRVSSKSQDMALQQHAVERASRARGDTITMVFSEKRSAKLTARPELDRLRAAARAGEVPRRFYVFRLDRLVRSDRAIIDILTIVEELRTVGIETTSVSDGFDLQGPAAEPIMAILAWGAKQERVAQEDRRAAAREAREARGLPFGRPRKVGDGDPRLVRARKLRAEGRSVREIAQHTGIKRSTLARALSQKSAAKTGAPA